MKKLLLGSKSPRRKELLQNMKLPFVVVSIDCDEDFKNLEPLAVAEYLALKKSNAYNSLKDDEILITADTTVILGETILNKPIDQEEARRMLSSLSGSMHLVSTGVCLRDDIKAISFTEVTEVYMKELSKKEIDLYISAFKPYDKAGGYGIQEWLGDIAIEKIVGSYTNVVGLPTSMVYQCLLNEFQFDSY